MTRMGEKNGFSNHSILSLRGITESVNSFPPNTGLVKQLKKNSFLSNMYINQQDAHNSCD